jgi:hypothetical protein
MPQINTFAASAAVAPVAVPRVAVRPQYNPVPVRLSVFSLANVFAAVGVTYHTVFAVVPVGVQAHAAPVQLVICPFAKTITVIVRIIKDAPPFEFFVAGEIPSVL